MELFALPIDSDDKGIFGGHWGGDKIWPTPPPRPSAAPSYSRAWRGGSLGPEALFESPRLWKLDNQHGCSPCLGRKKNKLALWSRDMTDGNLLWSSSGAEGGDAGLTEACQFQLTAMGSVVTVCNAFFPSRQVTSEG